MFARFDENPAMTLRVIKETKRYGRKDGRKDNVKTVYPLQTKFAGGYKKSNSYPSCLSKQEIIEASENIFLLHVSRREVGMVGVFIGIP